MPQCAVCGAACRGHCRYCSVSLCAAHRPRRGKCPKCKTLRASPAPALLAAIPPYASLVPSSSPSPSPDLTVFTSTELYHWLYAIEVRLRQKQTRERVYLDRRAARGVHTPTDDAYEADQQLEADLLALLTLLKNEVAP